MNSRTNLAYDTTLSNPYHIGIAKEQSNVRIRVSSKTKPSAQKKTHVISLAGILFITAFAFLVLCRGVMITDKSTNIDKKRAELNALITSNEKLQVEIDRALDLKKVEAIAQNQLGMRRAEKHQTIYVDLEQVDFVEKTIKKDLSPGKKSSEAITGILAYMD